MNAEYDAIFESVEKVGIKVTEKISVYIKVPMEKRFAANVPVPSGVQACTYLGSNQNPVTCRVYTVQVLISRTLHSPYR
jgi:hypothetical protein